MKFSNLLSYDPKFGIRGMQEKAQIQLEELCAEKGFSYLGAEHRIRELFQREVVVTVQISNDKRQSHAPAPEVLRLVPISAILIIASYSLDHLLLLDELYESSGQLKTTSSLKQIYIADFARLVSSSEVFCFYEQFGISRNMLPVLLRFRGTDPTEGFAGLKNVAKQSREIACTKLEHLLFKNLVEQRHLQHLEHSRPGAVLLNAEEWDLFFHLCASTGLTRGTSVAVGHGEKSFTGEVVIESAGVSTGSDSNRIRGLSTASSKTQKGKKTSKRAVETD